MIKFLKISTFALLLLINTNISYGKFFISNLSESDKENLIENDLWNEECPVNLERIKIVNVEYVDFDGNVHNDGTITVLDVVAKDTLKLFKELKRKKYPIHKIRSLHTYEDDSWKDVKNQTLGFSCRKILGYDDKFSIHSYGLAIDINPRQNPCIYAVDKYGWFRSLFFGKEEKKLLIAPDKEDEYMFINRTKKKIGMIEPYVWLFKKYGFKIWGGNWNSPADWMHFQTSRELAEKLSKTNYKDGVKIFKKYLKNKNSNGST